jgi:hypothetical protein
MTFNSTLPPIGWLYPTVAILAIWALTSLSTGMYAEAMRKIPGDVLKFTVVN